MPAIRAETSKYEFSPIATSVTSKRTPRVPAAKVEEKTVTEDCSICDVEFPADATARTAYRTQAGKAVTPHQWAIYDLARTIPCGSVVTYKDMCTALKAGSPRSVGSALRNNPFAPFVPCHRVIASTNFIGGFFGEWGKESKTGTQCNRKLEMLEKEGVKFDEKGFLADKKNLWKGMSAAATED